MGWLMVRKHPAVKSAGKKISMSDLEQNSLVMFQHRHYTLCFFLVGFLLPTVLPHLLWGESLTTAYFMAVIRCVFPHLLHIG
jgi:stearoyl-CoA desaturase (delta-9 desaturase)